MSSVGWLTAFFAALAAVAPFITVFATLRWVRRRARADAEHREVETDSIAVKTANEVVGMVASQSQKLEQRVLHLEQRMDHILREADIYSETVVEAGRLVGLAIPTFDQHLRKRSAS